MVALGLGWHSWHPDWDHRAIYYGGNRYYTRSVTVYNRGYNRPGSPTLPRQPRFVYNHNANYNTAATITMVGTVPRQQPAVSRKSDLSRQQPANHGNQQYHGNTSQNYNHSGSQPKPNPSSYKGNSGGHPQSNSGHQGGGHPSGGGGHPSGGGGGDIRAAAEVVEDIRAAVVARRCGSAHH